MQNSFYNIDDLCIIDGRPPCTIFSASSKVYSSLCDGDDRYMNGKYISVTGFKTSNFPRKSEDVEEIFRIGKKKEGSYYHIYPSSFKISSDLKSQTSHIRVDSKNNPCFWCVIPYSTMRFCDVDYHS